MRRTDRSFLTWCTALFLAVGASAACDDDVGTGNEMPPGTDVDAQGAASTVDSVVTSFFEGNEALGSLDILGPFIAGVTAQPTVASVAGLELGMVQDVSAQIQASLEGFRRLEGPRPVRGIVSMPDIPEPLLGATCIWDPTAGSDGTGGYVKDQEAPPLPESTDIRFRLYSVDLATDRPELPLNDIGFSDITDNSDFAGSPATLDVGLTADITELGTLLDYSVTGEFSETTFSLNMLGAVSDGTNDLNFDFSIGGNNTDGSSTSSFNVILGSLVVSVELSRNVDGGGGIATLVTDSRTDDVIEFIILFDADRNIEAGSGILVNENLLGVISGTLDSASLTRADGSPLTDQELAALANLFDGLGSMFDASGELLRLGAMIVGVAVS